MKARRPRRWLLGVLLLLAAVCLNTRSLAPFLGFEGHLGQPMLRRLVQMAELVLAGLAGLLVMGLWRPRVRSRRWLLLGAWLGLLLGSYGALLAWEILPPAQVDDLATLAQHLRGSRFGDNPERLRELHAQLQACSDPDQALRLRVRLGEELLRSGEPAQAVEVLQVGLQPDADSELHNRQRLKLAVAFLRWGESQQCLAMCNRESCLYPIAGGGRWQNPQPAEAAVVELERLLALEPGNPEALWLLHIARMVQAPESEPARLPLDTAGVPRFRNLAAELGVDAFDLCGGSVMDDIDGDGLLDLMCSSFQSDQPVRYYRNEGDGTFAEWTERAGLSGQLGGFNLIQADYDNDGRLDLLVLRGAWLRATGRVRNSLLKQQSDGSFVDVTEAAGLAGRAYPTLAAAWGDYDNDGLLDVYIGNERLNAQRFAPGQLFHNQGDGSFEDRAAEAGVRNFGNAKSVAWGDYDDDGDLDLFVANFGQPNRLYQNQGDGSFRDLASELGVAAHEPGNFTFTSWFFDYDNDGRLDLFTGGYGVRRVSEAVRDYLGLERTKERLELFQNTGSGFVSRSEELGLDHARAIMGANFGDIDNDGWLDFYLGTGAPPFEFLVPNSLYRNLQGQGFAEVTAAAGVGHLQKGHGIAFGDLDNDGDLDIYAQLGGFYQDDRFYNALFENPGNTHHWITLRLEGSTSNRSAIGARVEVELDGRSLHRVVGSGASFGCSSLQLEIGLGEATRVTTLRIRWPAGGSQELHDLPVDRVLAIREGDSAYQIIDLPRIQLRGSGG